MMGWWILSIYKSARNFLAGFLVAALTVAVVAQQPVRVLSGLISAVQSGTWTVQPGNTANTTAWKVDGSAVTQPVSFSGSVASSQVGTWTVQPGNTPNTTPWLMQIRDAAGNARGANVDASNRLLTFTDINGVSLNAGRIPVFVDINGVTLNTGRIPGFVDINGVTLNSGRIPVLADVNNGSATSTIGGVSNVAYVSFVAGDPCQSNPKVYLAISQNDSTQIIAGTSSKKTYLCSLALVAGAAEKISVVSGTGTKCATSTVANIGALTASSGLSFAANGGIMMGNGGAAIAATTVNADNTCILQASSNLISGNATYVVQ